MSRIPQVLLDSFVQGDYGASYGFAGLEEVIVAHDLDDVLPALARVEQAVALGFHAAGFICYEAASGLNPNFSTQPPGPFPLLWFGIFRERILRNPSDMRGEETNGGWRTSDWRISCDRQRYNAAIDRIREFISLGDTYQVNFTARQRFRFDGSARAYYRDLCRSQSASFCAFLDIGRYQVLSASPELCFSLRDGLLTARPMKGTARRGRWTDEDAKMREALRGSAKERAENLMIVDLLRNDLGIVAETGSVRVESLFTVETLETLHQMTSTITARLKPDTCIVELLSALFPCGSVTGAPKRRTMEIIAGLEDSPRGVYTGCIGYISPTGGKTNAYEAVFNVAIRTVVIDAQTGMAELGIGSGVTWESRADDEYAECLIKGSFALSPTPEFQLIETLLFEPGSGYFLLNRHLARLARSVGYFNFALDMEPVERLLASFGEGLSGNSKIRVLLAGNGDISLETAPVLCDPPGTPLTVTLADAKVDSSDRFLYHKTTNRSSYTEELALHPGCCDVIFCNERDEVTEGANHNLVVRLGGRLVTPPVACGLLPGVFREELLAREEIEERVVTRKELIDAEEVYLINSVRKWRRVRLG
ncbi:MAG: aminodeoxychorismate synthase component I [Geobacteraceae bacterium]